MPIAQTMKGGMVQAMKPTMKIFNATAPLSCASSPAPRVDADDGDEHHETEIFQHIAGCIRRVA
jgi:hypothetical protein